MRIGERVEKARLRRGWSRAHLAAKTGINECSIKKLELRNKQLHWVKMRAIYDALGLCTDIFEKFEKGAANGFKKRK